MYHKTPNLNPYTDQLFYYVRLHGSYEALVGGWTEDALVDFTGGIGSRINLRKPGEVPSDFFQDILKQDKRNTLMGCSIKVGLLTSSACTKRMCFG